MVKLPHGISTVLDRLAFFGFVLAGVFFWLVFAAVFLAAVFFLAVFWEAVFFVLRVWFSRWIF